MQNRRDTYYVEDTAIATSLDEFLNGKGQGLKPLPDKQKPGEVGDGSDRQGVRINSFTELYSTYDGGGIWNNSRNANPRLDPKLLKLCHSHTDGHERCLGLFGGCLTTLHNFGAYVHEISKLV